MNTRIKRGMVLAVIIFCLPLAGCKCFHGEGDGERKQTGDERFKIIIQPEDQVVKVGDSATFIVVAEPPPLLYQWKKNGVDIVGATSPSYTLGATTLPDVAFYQCDITHGKKHHTNKAALQLYSLNATGFISSVSGPFQPANGSKSCIGAYLGYVKFKTTSGSSWWTPPLQPAVGGKPPVSGTISDTSAYTTKVEAVEYPSLMSWCTNKTLPFPVTTGSKYAFTTYVVTPPSPAPGEVLTLSVNWSY